MNFNNKIYRSQSFVNRIQMNLAEISANPEDEFTLVNAYYDPKMFDCELCNHRNCMYAYEIKNVKTEKVLKVGSECVHHFKDKGIDIDLAEALMKRVMSATNKARRDLKERLGQKAWDALTEEEQKEIGWKRAEWKENAGKEAYKALSKEEKRSLIVDQFMIIQAKELLFQVSMDKHYLSEEEIANIASLGLMDEKEKAEKRAEAQRAANRKVEIEKECRDYIKSLKEKWLEIEDAKIAAFTQEWESLEGGYSYNNVPQMVERYRHEYEKHVQYSWLLDYDGENQVVNDIKRFFNTRGYMTDRQRELAKSIINNKNDIDVDFEQAIGFLTSNYKDNKFFASVASYYKRMGRVSDKQKSAIMKSYEKLK